MSFKEWLNEEPRNLNKEGVKEQEIIDLVSKIKGVDKVDVPAKGSSLDLCITAKDKKTVQSIKGTDIEKALKKFKVKHYSSKDYGFGSYQGVYKINPKGDADKPFEVYMSFKLI